MKSHHPVLSPPLYSNPDPTTREGLLHPHQESSSSFPKKKVTQQRAVVMASQLQAMAMAWAPPLPLSTAATTLSTAPRASSSSWRCKNLVRFASSRVEKAFRALSRPPVASSQLAFGSNSSQFCGEESLASCATMRRGVATLSRRGVLWSRGVELRRRDGFCRSAVESETAEATQRGIESSVGGGSNGGGSEGGGGDDGGGGGETLGWISSALVFAFYGALVYYAAVLAPGQTPYRDQYFVEKLVGLRSGDGFVLNTVLVCEFYLMGVWPMIYASLLLPSGRSEKNAAPVWPFLVLSFAVGAFALVPYFGLWSPPPPTLRKEELSKFPLNLLENKLVSYGLLASGVGLIVAAALAGTESWTEFYQYFRESKFIHVMSIDFLTLSSLAPFWVYNDMAARRWLDKGFWLLPLSLIPLLGPALYLIFRPPLPLSMIEDEK